MTSHSSTAKIHPMYKPMMLNAQDFLEKKMTTRFAVLRYAYELSAGDSLCMMDPCGDSTWSTVLGLSQREIGMATQFLIDEFLLREDAAGVSITDTGILTYENVVRSPSAAVSPFPAYTVMLPIYRSFVPSMIDAIESSPLFDRVTSKIATIAEESQTEAKALLDELRFRIRQGAPDAEIQTLLAALGVFLQNPMLLSDVHSMLGHLSDAEWG